MRSTTVAMALLSTVVAADTVTTIWLPGFDQQPLVASIIGGDATATTYSIACAAGTDPTDCGVATGFTMIEGPKTMSLEMVDGDKSLAYADLHCDIDASASQAACTETIGGSYANYQGVTTTTFTSDDFESGWMPVTITAGSVTGGAAATTGASATESTASATTKAAASAATTAASTAASTGSAASTSSGLSTVASSSSSSTGTASAKATSSVASTGGMPQITGNAQWAMGGVAVAVALAAL
ncbi:uncharacterized protein BHQ10_008660 [Talaromyces amestolkiae]|uniref:GPI anchored protein n=1 Tax=Talaromyces amestolkiae TaxID=1196081 RepID=A0A364LA21_TALAM|nr:uncharacterized protein BHQ10_008660 [Talaromyces amestolkiae]RAO72648.1 hypothetical protein BHQ10_008660 [Talaromyces amestolkiae]